jgi:two-component system CheB/CheR fusion protein
MKAGNAIFNARSPDEIAAPAVRPLEVVTAREFALLFEILRGVSGVDFSGYKFPSVKRRILRRMAFKKIENLSEYAGYLRAHHEEAEALVQDLLIGVTSFFRNPEAFESLRRIAFPVLVNNRAPEDPIRVWVPGCSTGEEAYSHAICLYEYLSESQMSFPLQVFGTDVNETAVKKGRAGIFKRSSMSGVSSDRLAHFFTRVDGGYHINKVIRDVCVFARQNIISDPPFSRMDIVSCRNLLIYLDQPLQRRVTALLHYALKPGGYLMLGQNEGLSGKEARLFEVVDEKNRLYIKKPVPSPVSFAYTPAFGDSSSAHLAE